MSHTVLGMAIGAILALTWIGFGFWACVFVAVAIAIGAGVGRVIDGKLNLRSVGDALRGRRSS